MAKVTVILSLVLVTMSMDGFQQLAESESDVCLNVYFVMDRFDWRRIFLSVLYNPLKSQPFLCLELIFIFFVCGVFLEKRFGSFFYFCLFIIFTILFGISYMIVCLVLNAFLTKTLLTECQLIETYTFVGTISYEKHCPPGVSPFAPAVYELTYSDGRKSVFVEETKSNVIYKLECITGSQYVLLLLLFRAFENSSLHSYSWLYWFSSCVLINRYVTTTTLVLLGALGVSLAECLFCLSAILIRSKTGFVLRPTQEPSRAGWVLGLCLKQPPDRGNINSDTEGGDNGFDHYLRSWRADEDEYS